MFLEFFISDLMKEERIEQILSIACLVCGMASFLLVCIHWAVALILAIAAIALGVFHSKRYHWNRITKAGVICSITYIVFWLLVLGSIRFYYSLIHL